MRGDDNQQDGMFSYVSPEKRVPANHPLRPVRKMVDEILKEMSPQFASHKSFRRKDGQGKPPGRAERWTLRGKSERTKPMNRQRIPRRACSRSPKEARPSWATWDMY
jgi:hypothetical protein